jgi:hypothetical protein
VQGTEGALRTIWVADGTVTTPFSENAQISAPTWLTDDRMLVVMTGTGSPMLADGDGLYLVDFVTHECSILSDGAATVTSVARPAAPGSR